MKHRQIGDKVFFYRPNLHSFAFYGYWGKISFIDNRNDILRYGDDVNVFAVENTFSSVDEAINACHKVYNSIDDKVKIVEESYKLHLDFLEKERIKNENI